MVHFFAPGENGETGSMSLKGPDVKHCVKVLRMGPGDRMIVSDGQDREYLCEIRETGPDFVHLDVVSDVLPSAEPNRQITLFQGLPKSDKMDYIIQKTVELGVCRIVPVEMSRSVVRLDEKKKQSRRERWQKLAESASKQSGRGMIPEIGEVCGFKEALKEARDLDRILVPYESAENMAYTRSVLAEVPEGSRVAFFIGPEGGFDPEEIAALKEIGAAIITLGPRILRTETAGPAVLAMAALLWEN